MPFPCSPYAPFLLPVFQHRIWVVIWIKKAPPSKSTPDLSPFHWGSQDGGEDEWAGWQEGYCSPVPWCTMLKAERFYSVCFCTPSKYVAMLNINLGTKACSNCWMKRYSVQQRIAMLSFFSIKHRYSQIFY